MAYSSSSSWEAASLPEGYQLTYRVRNQDAPDTRRSVHVLATPEEIQQLVRDGYLVRERLFSSEQVELLRAALDEVAERELAQKNEVSTGRRFGGLFLRHLMDKHQAFLDLLKFQPTLSVARAVLGPQVQWRGLSARITYPDQPNQETHWHFHQRVIPEPIPPFFSRPHVVDCLLYLDDVNDQNGPLCVVPQSHQDINDDLPADDYGEKPGQVTLRLPAGSCVIMHGSSWHRAMPTTPEGSVRRLLLWSYSATWLKGSIYGEKPENGLTQVLIKSGDEETRELLGVAGYM